jgi:hypothetical protein
MLLCGALAVGACQPALDPAPRGAPGADRATREAALEVADCTPGGNFCGAASATKPIPWKGQPPPVAGPGQSFHAWESPDSPLELIAVLADVEHGKILWAVSAKGAEPQGALLQSLRGRGPVDIVRPPPPPPPVGNDWLILERALRYQQLGAEAEAAAQQCL